MVVVVLERECVCVYVCLGGVSRVFKGLGEFNGSQGAD